MAIASGIAKKGLSFLSEDGRYHNRRAANARRSKPVRPAITIKRQKVISRRRASGAELLVFRISSLGLPKLIVPRQQKWGLNPQIYPSDIEICEPVSR